MRRTATWLLVGAVAALGIAAAVDALRGEDERAAPVRPQAAAAVAGLGPSSDEAARRLREAGISGVLTYSDGDCRLHALSLPELEPARAPSFQMCRPATSTGELGVLDGDVVWAGLGYGAVQVVLSRERLSRAIGGDGPGAEARFRAVQALSLDEERLLVLADSTSGPEERVLAVFDGPRAEFAHLSWWADGARALRPSPRGNYYALLRGERAGAQVFTRDGRAVEVAEDVTAVRGVAWSPDERWTVLATREGLFVFPTERPRELVIRIPLAVRDLDWSEAGLASSP